MLGPWPVRGGYKIRRQRRGETCCRRWFKATGVLVCLLFFWNSVNKVCFNDLQLNTSLKLARVQHRKMFIYSNVWQFKGHDREQDVLRFLCPLDINQQFVSVSVCLEGWQTSCEVPSRSTSRNNELKLFNGRRGKKTFIIEAGMQTLEGISAKLTENIK